MVRGSEKTYGELMLEARSKEDFFEVGEILGPVMDKFKLIIEEAVQGNYNKGVRGKYYIHIYLRKEPFAVNTLHIYPQCRRTRPSPYQDQDHYLWSVEDDGNVQFEWCIPSKEILGYILKNPNQFDANYVAMLRQYTSDRLEKAEDYAVNGKLI